MNTPKLTQAQRRVLADVARYGRKSYISPDRDMISLNVLRRLGYVRVINSSVESTSQRGVPKRYRVAVEVLVDITDAGLDALAKDGDK